VTTGIELLKTLPETPAQTQHALHLHITLGAALQMTKVLSLPEAEHTERKAAHATHQTSAVPRCAACRMRPLGTPYGKILL